MTFLVVLLLIGLLAAFSFAAYQFSDARRWRETAAEAREQGERDRLELEAARRAAVGADVQVKLLTQTQRQLEDRFRALAADALESNSQLFLDRSRDQMQHLVEPVNQSLRRFEEQVQAIERSRIGAYSELTTQVQALAQLQERVRQSTDQLKTALRSPSQRGRWGEMQLRRVVELAGMSARCDFDEQVTVATPDGAVRPDLVVRLAGGKNIVVDSKVSLAAYLEAAETDDDDVRTARLDAHARHVRDHVDRLAGKAYWTALSPSPEFVILFIPGEAFLAPALERDPGLLEYALGRKVHIATPTTLVTMLRTAQYAWQQAALAENARAVFDLGRQLYERISGLGGHVDRLGRALAKAVSTYNQAVGSLESRVLPSARKLSELGVVDGELTAPGVVEETPRALSAPELAPDLAAAPELDSADLDGALIDPADVGLVRVIR